jgi:hypothetical protein
MRLGLGGAVGGQAKQTRQYAVQWLHRRSPDGGEFVASMKTLQLKVDFKARALCGKVTCQSNNGTYAVI